MERKLSASVRNTDTHLKPIREVGIHLPLGHIFMVHFWSVKTEHPAPLGTRCPHRVENWISSWSMASVETVRANGAVANIATDFHHLSCSLWSPIEAYPLVHRCLLSAAAKRADFVQ